MQWSSVTRLVPRLLSGVMEQGQSAPQSYPAMPGALQRSANTGNIPKRPQPIMFIEIPKGGCTCAEVLLLPHRVQALAIQLQQVRSILLGLGRAAAGFLKPHTTGGRTGLAVAGRHGNELHQIQCDIFVAA